MAISVADAGMNVKVAKTNKFDVFACGETTSGKLGVLGDLP